MTSDLISIAISVIATLLGALLSLFAKHRGRVFTGTELIATAYAMEAQRDLREEIRLPEVIQTLKDEENRRSLYRYSSASLVVGQFIIGGVLTTSFVRSALSEEIVGLLGLLVLASSLVSQHFRPDLLHKTSAVKAHRLRALKRWAEDELYEASRGTVDDARILAARRKVTAALEEIERSDVDFPEEQKTDEA